MAITTKRGQPITGGRTAMQPRPPVLSDAADTSRDAQRQVMQPGQPFSNPYGTVNVPAPVNRAASHPYGNPANSLLPKRAGARIETNVGIGSPATTRETLLASGD